MRTERDDPGGDSDHRECAVEASSSYEAGSVVHSSRAPLPPERVFTYATHHSAQLSYLRLHLSGSQRAWKE